MSWSRRSLLAALPSLAACGFEPVYAPGKNGRGVQGRVRVAEPEDADAYLLVRDLEDRLGRTADPAFDLNLALIIEIVPGAYDADREIRRYTVLGSADYVLRDTTTRAKLTSGRVESFTGYSATGSTVATLAAERDARARLMTILADQIASDLIAFDAA